MKSKQIGYVFIAVIVIGMAGLALRLISAGSSELTLEGILPVSPDVIDAVTIDSPSGQQSKLEKVNGVWLIGREEAFAPKLTQLWAATLDIDGAQLIAQNPANHARMGVEEGQGVNVAFWLGEFKQEEFIVGDWTQRVRLCYLRKPARNEVYAVPCPYGNIFDADSDGWRNPVVARIPRAAVQSVEFAYPDEEFLIRREAQHWVVEEDDAVEPADVFAVNAVLGTLEALIASGFAPESETQSLDFTGPEGISIRVITQEDSGFPTTRVRLLPRDDVSFYARTPLQPTIFIVDARIAAGLLQGLDAFLPQN